MGIFKVQIVICLIIVFTLVSCNNNSTGGSSKYQKLLKEYQSVQKEKDEAIHSAYAQLENINSIFEQLSAVNADIDTIKINIGNAEVPRADTQVEKIDNYIENIKKEIDQLENRNEGLKSNNLELAKTIGYLKNIVFNKEQEINTMKENLNVKDTIIEKQVKTILQKDSFIKEQEGTISARDQEIKQLQIEKWRNMGDELFNVYAEYQDYTGGLFRKSENEKKMAQNKRNVLEKARKCYTEAVNLGADEDIPNMSRIVEALNSISAGKTQKP